jgi:hypothetical protein
LYTQRMNPTMSNGNDHPNFPPPPNEPPEAGDSKSRSEQPNSDDGQAAADDVTSSPSSQTEDSNTPAEAADASESSADSSSSQSPSPADSSSQTEGSSQAKSPSSADSDASKSSVPDDQAPPLGTPSDDAPARPTVAPAAPQQNQAPQNSGSGPQSGSPYGAPQQGNGSPAGNAPQPPAGPYPGAAPQNSAHQNGQNNQYGQNNQHQGGQYQNAQYPGAQQPGGQQPGGQYPGSQYGSPYPGASNQAAPNQSGQPQTGSGPNTNRTGSGPGQSQAIPQPAPAPGFAGSQNAATRADSRPEKKKSKMPLFITLGAVALVIILVLVGFLVIGSVNKGKYGPDKVAEDYVAALEKGDFAGAEKIAPSPRPDGTNLDLLSKNFTDASSAKIEKAKVESSKVDGDKGTVTVSYELDGNPYQVDLKAKKDGKQDLFFDKWKLTGPELNVISLDIPAADGLTVNGEDYKAKSGTTSFAVYPGTYDFKVPSSKWVSEASDTASVNFPKASAPGSKPNEGQVPPTTLNLDLTPTDAFQKEVQKQVEAELKKCFDNKSIKPKCKFIKFDPTEIPVGGSDKKLDDLAKKDTAKWDMKEMPKVKASFGAGDTNTGSFFTDKPGKFNFKVDGKAAGSSYFSNSNPLSVSGSVKINGDKLKVEFFDF